MALARKYVQKLDVRVIQGYMDNNTNRPKFLGYSYDGLYTTTSYKSVMTLVDLRCTNSI